MNRTKSAGQAAFAAKVTNEEIRNICKRVSPYIAHQWREVCEELGVADNALDHLESDYGSSRMSELAFQGLCCWQEMVGQAASREKLLKVTQFLGLRRAEEELKSMSQKRLVPYMGRPVTAPSAQDVPLKKQAKQKALANRLSRPKSSANQEQDKTVKSKQVKTEIPTGMNPLVLQLTPSKPTDICEVKLKITVKAVQRFDNDELEQTQDTYKSTKDDFKHTCYSFVKLVMSNKRSHFKELKDLLGYEGITVQRLCHVGFNIHAFVLCFNLGAFEILYQNYVTGRLKKIVHAALVTKTHLDQLKARRLELSVDIEEGLINKYRDILLVREPIEEANTHPVDAIVDYFHCDDDDPCDGVGHEPDLDEIRNFDLQIWRMELYDKILTVDNRCELFKDSLKDLLVTLRIVLPGDKQTLNCLQDVINCYHYLKQSKSMAHGNGIDLLYEYIVIVNIIRLTVKGIGEKTLLVTFDETLHPDSCELFTRLLSEIEGMLEPGNTFGIDENMSKGFKISGAEKELFEGLLCYLPRLVSILYKICDALKSTKDKKCKEVSAAEDEARRDIERSNDDKENVNEENNNVLKDFNGLSLKVGQSTVNYINTWKPE